jgi:hypothetical protein
VSQPKGGELHNEFQREKVAAQRTTNEPFAGNDIWDALIKICNAQSVPFVVVVHSDRHRDKISAKQRAKVLRKLQADGWPRREIGRVCSMTARALRKVLRLRVRLISKVNISARKRHGGIDLISPAQYPAHYWRLRLPVRFTYKKTRSGIVCKRVTLSKHPSYQAWRVMFDRCYDKFADGYEHYGAHGIRVCSRWFDFKKFVKDMGERPYGAMLRRIDRHGHYIPQNCHWVTRKSAQTP